MNFNPASAAVQKGAELSAGATDQIGVVTAIYNYVINNLTYDTAKAQSVQSGYLPNVDVVLAQHTGICFDYAALMTAMLRSQNIPTKLVVRVLKIFIVILLISVSFTNLHIYPQFYF